MRGENKSLNTTFTLQNQHAVKKKMACGRIGECVGVREEIIKKACSLALKAHKSPEEPYLCEKSRNSSETFFAFPGTWSASDWFSRKPFGETKINLSLFPSLKSIGNNEVATVNEALLRRFETILGKSEFEKEVEKAVSQRKQIVFTGHSSGGPMAILATLWFLDKYLGPNTTQTPPLCVTFGSPLTGDRIFSHALRREKWACYFIHFIMRYDIVPRIMLAPLSSIEQAFHHILAFFNPKSPFYKHESIAIDSGNSLFFLTVMRYASYVTSHAASNLMGSTNPLLETVTAFVELSPYRPFGTYIFCTGNGKLVVVKNPDAVLQMLFYCLQLSCEAEGAEIAYRSLKEHLVYDSELQESLEMQNVVYLDSLEKLPLSSNGISISDEAGTINAALNDLGLSTRAKLCLRAAGELEKQKLKTQTKIDSNKNDIANKLNSVQQYQSGCELRKIGYYDAFKLQDDINDFNTNLNRLELTGMWDEIIILLRQHQLPDEFEGREEWIELGTKYRRLVEPLDIANYYRHSKNEDTGPYMAKARPSRFRYTQRWREHAERMSKSSSESCFWAEVEEIRTRNYDDVKEKIVNLERELFEWVRSRDLGKDVFLDGSTFVKWWKTLPRQHQERSSLNEFIS